jgi:hypothetical protein
MVKGVRFIYFPHARGGVSALKICQKKSSESLPHARGGVSEKKRKRKKGSDLFIEQIKHKWYVMRHATTITSEAPPAEPVAS